MHWRRFISGFIAYDETSNLYQQIYYYQYHKDQAGKRSEYKMLPIVLQKFLVFQYSSWLAIPSVIEPMTPLTNTYLFSF